MFNINNSESWKVINAECKSELINIDSIKIVEKLHTKGLSDKRMMWKVKSIANKCNEKDDFNINADNKHNIVVRKVSDGYALVSGLAKLLICQRIKGLTEVPCYVLDYNICHKQFMRKYNIIENTFAIPKDTENMVHIKDIIVPKYFSATKPNFDKVSNKYADFKKKHKIDTAISVIKTEEGKYILKDEYIRFKFLKAHKETWIPIKIVNK